jgi:hypothetical protein
MFMQVFAFFNNERNETMWTSRLRNCFYAVCFTVAMAGTSFPVDAQETGKKEVAEETKAKGRLPAYYKDVVDMNQKEEIYKLQEDYANKIAPLQEQIKKLIAQRDTAIEKVLSPEQLTKLNKIREEAAAKRKTMGLGPATKTAEKTSEKAE